MNISRWKESIIEYNLRIESVADVIEYADWREPYSPQLEEVCKKGEITNHCSVSNKDIEVLESRLNTKLPPSYIEFLKYTNGMLMPNRFINLLPLEHIDWFYTLNQEWVDIWNENGEDNITDEKYFTYGKEQDTCQMKCQYLKDALQISDSMEGEVLLLNPNVKFGEEWEAWYFANYLAGAIRFKSFRELMEFFFIPEED